MVDESIPKNFGVLLYDGFQLTDVCGPIDVLNVLSSHIPGITLCLLSECSSPVSTSPKRWPTPDMPPFTTSQRLLPTHTFSTAPSDIDVLIIPGGMGCFDPSDPSQPNPSVVDPIVQFTLSRYPSLKYLLTVCTGSGIAALTGLLDGKRATTFKGAYNILAAWRPQVKWVRSARWVVDGNVWTSSGVSAGTDLMFAFVKEVYGAGVAKDVAVWMEYERHENGEVDPFAAEESLIESGDAGTRPQIAAA